MTVATILTGCDGCGAKIHEAPGEVKFRVDMFRTGTGKRGFDLCASCFAKIVEVVPAYEVIWLEG